jgi:hypothetical protein
MIVVISTATIQAGMSAPDLQTGLESGFQPSTVKRRLQHGEC